MCTTNDVFAFKVGIFTYVIMMFIVETFLAEKRCIEIREAGVLPLTKGDAGLQFYLKVVNRMVEDVEVYTRMVQCCETLSPEDISCEHMDLMGNNDLLERNVTRTYTLVYPNLYPYNRKGECLLAIVHKTANNRTKEERHHILFDTYLTRENPPPVIKDFYDPAEISQCASIDQDPFDNCHPVDCHIKYSGYRGYYNYAEQRCENIPECMSNPTKDLPDVIYDERSNTCRDLSEGVSDEEVQHLTYGDLEPECTGKLECPAYEPQFLHCHHGFYNKDLGTCVCDDDWASPELPDKDFCHHTHVFHMCNIKTTCSVWNDLFAPIDAGLILISAIMAIIIAVTIIVLLYNY